MIQVFRQIDFFVLSFENTTDRKAHTRYYFPKVEIKDYHVIIDGSYCFGQLAKNDKIMFEHIQKIATGQTDDYKTGCLLDYSYFKKKL